MLESAWLFTGIMAFVWTLVTVAGAGYVDRDDATGDVLAMVAGVVGFVLWGVWTFGALDVVVVGDSTTFQFTHPELAIVGVTMAMIPGYIALTGPFELAKRAREPRQDQL